MKPGARAVLSTTGLGTLLEALRTDGYQLVAPTVRDQAIVFGEIRGLADLPVGWTEVQDAGTYRLARRPDDALFGYASGAQSLKPFLFVPRVRLFRARRTAAGMAVEAEQAEARPLALFGARACDLHAIEIQDRVFLRGPYADPDYAARRSNAFVVAVQCTQAGGTCFCASVGSGPRARAGFDLALTELLDGDGHRFVVEVGSERGAAMLARVPSEAASDGDCRLAEGRVEQVASSMGRALDTADVESLLFRNLEHPRWDEVASRCLSCTNCTMVCPTCFCANVEDVTDLTGATAERWRRWDSCFTLDHSWVHGGHVRSATRSRYRQWLTHKLAGWIQQFGTSGCVGCGRCITWCPAGIDITQEVAAIRATDGKR